MEMNLADLRHLRPATVPPARCESLIVAFRSNAETIAQLLPAPLRPDGSAAASLQFCATTVAGGRGVEIETRLAIDAELNGMPVAFVVRRWAAEWPADDAETDAGSALGRARFIELHGTLTAVLESGRHPLIIASMSRRRHFLGPLAPRRCPTAVAAAWLARPQLALRRAIDALGRPVARLAGRPSVDIEVRDARSGPAELDLAAGAAPLPVLGVLGALHVIGETAPARAVVARGARACGAASRGLHHIEEACA
jgi:acetoacetate decarboxylase